MRGTVQGVGFRPFVYRIARAHSLCGWVLNDTDGVLLEVEGELAQIGAFLGALESGAPPHARVDALEVTPVTEINDDIFEIRPSPDARPGIAGILPDLATCDSCRAEVFDPDDRRHRYPFTNCTQCGPRFSILERLPYDRMHTTMAPFTMCALCQAEYDDPVNRRFHAQPNACPDCGPQLALGAMRGDAALRASEDLLREGQIVAVKGLGGFHLLVNALDRNALLRLRKRKGRETKPLAVMFGDHGQLSEFCDASEVEHAAVTSAAAPIVLMRNSGRLPDAIAPSNPLVGAMLPYTPLHHILLRDLGFPVVATSANVSGLPVCTDVDTARALLGHVADAFLDHDRAIRRPVEDSVVRQYEDDVVVLRRGRGLAPGPVARCARAGILGRGAQLQCALAVSQGGAVIAGPHIGNVSDDVRSIETFEAAVADFEALFRPHLTVVDRHPDYTSRRSATSAMEVQHHHAHAAACMAEHGVERVLAVVWDGSGYGGDGTIWGGEFFDATPSSFVRVAHLRQFSLVGGEVAIREPGRQALALLWELDLEPSQIDHRVFLERMLAADLNSPRTSSAGRLFDAVSSLLGFAPHHVSFDGEAAINLEHAAAANRGALLPTPQLVDGVLDWGPLIRALVGSGKAASAPVLAAGFHDALARSIAEVATQVDVEHVALVGGCFQNRRLLESAAAELRAVGRKPLWCRQIPPGDGGIAVGQVIVAAHSSASI